MNATTEVIPSAPLFFRRLQMSLTRCLDQSSQNYDVDLPLNKENREELRWWDHHMCKWNGKPHWRRDRLDNRTRCIPDEMGGNVSEPADWRGESHVHQLSVTPSSPHVCQISHRDWKQLGWDNFPWASPIGERPVDVVSRTKLIDIIAQHLPGLLNQIADVESLIMRYRNLINKFIVIYYYN